MPWRNSAQNWARVKRLKSRRRVLEATASDQGRERLIEMATELNPNLEKIVAKFEKISEPKRRYEYLLWFAKRLPPMAEELQVSNNKVLGCVSQVYVHAVCNEGIVEFQATSDAQITKGLVAFLVEGLAGLSPCLLYTSPSPRDA